MTHNVPEPQPPRELLWRRIRSEAERARCEAWLQAHPEARADWELETALTEALVRLPNAPVPSNFTARVLQAVEREESARSPSPAPRWRAWFGWRWLPRFVLLALLLGVAVFWHQRHQSRAQAELRRSLTLIAAMPAIPNPQALEDFEVVRSLSRTPPWDEELLALMQ